MSVFLTYALIFGLPVSLTVVVILWRQRRNTRRALERWEEAKVSGLTEPASLHPVIDPALCLGCGSCVSACPEGDILGLVNRKAQLVSPSSCIGHGACKEACPADAISLVFGSERRGVEIPAVSEDFETSVPGIFIAGELGGMGLIKNAIAQGQQAANAAFRRAKKILGKCDFDLLIIGAGPAGLSAALAAKQKNMRYLVLEQDTIGGTVAHYPRGKVVMTAPAVLPLVGKFRFREASKEALVEFWQAVVKDQQLEINTGQRVIDVRKTDAGFTVGTESNAGSEQLTAATVLLTMGRRGTPRKLGVPGEDQSKVVYRLVEPEQYKGCRVLVVGGGDSALEAALAVAGQPDTTVILSYRGDGFSRAKAKNRDAIAAADNTGDITVLLQSQVLEIKPDTVILQTSKGQETFDNDIVIVCAGGVLPTPFLKKIGIQVNEKFGTL